MATCFTQPRNYLVKKTYNVVETFAYVHIMLVVLACLDLEIFKLNARRIFLSKE